jgi:hypothetical protein
VRKPRQLELFRASRAGLSSELFFFPEERQLLFDSTLENADFRVLENDRAPKDAILCRRLYLFAAEWEATILLEVIAIGVP